MMTLGYITLFGLLRAQASVTWRSTRTERWTFGLAPRRCLDVFLSIPYERSFEIVQREVVDVEVT